jgi:hypothetical protein
MNWHRQEFGGKLIDGGPWMFLSPIRTMARRIVIKDVIADAILQQILLRPADYSVIATLNLNGDYVSDALAAQVGGIGIAPGANLSDSVAMFEATHGTAPKYAGKDYVNPGSEILSAEMMLRHMGWTEAADLIISSMEKSILSKKVTYDFARLMGRDPGVVLGLRAGDDRPHVRAAQRLRMAGGPAHDAGRSSCSHCRSRCVSRDRASSTSDHSRVSSKVTACAWPWPAGTSRICDMPSADLDLSSAPSIATRRGPASSPRSDTSSSHWGCSV